MPVGSQWIAPWFLLFVVACGGNGGSPDGGVGIPPGQCVPGWWVDFQSSCGIYYCGNLGAQVPECSHSDCKEQGFLWLSPDGGELDGTLAYSATAKTLSAPNEQPTSWGFTADGGKLYLAASPGQAQPFTCSATDLFIGKLPAGAKYLPMPANFTAAMQQGLKTNQWVGIAVQ